MNLTKTQTVLTRRHGRLFEHAEEGGRSHMVILDRDVWDEMDHPETITVTIEPGDRLNP